MADTQIMNLLNRMLSQMSPQQKKKLEGILGSEDGIRQALSSVDSEKAQKIARDLHLESQIPGDVGQLLNAVKNNPELLKSIQKKQD